MNSSSLIGSKVVGGRGIYEQLATYGCSEFPALNKEVIEYISFNFFGIKYMSEEVIKAAFGDDYSLRQYVDDYTNFTLKALEGFNNSGKFDDVPFTPYIVKDLIDDRSFPEGEVDTAVEHSGDEYSVITSGNFNIRIEGLSIDSIIGIRTNCLSIRKATKASWIDEKQKSHSNNETNRCRKVQIGHTILRYMWSSGHPIAIVALKIHKFDPSIDPLDCLWLASRVNSIIHPYSSDYGDIYQLSAEYFNPEDSYALFAKADNDLLNSVMRHFLTSTSDDISKIINTNIAPIDFSKITKGMTLSLDPTLSQSRAVYGRMDDAFLAALIDILNEAKARATNALETCDFEFTKNIFSSVAPGVPYDGFYIPESRLGRIVFKDEEGSYLSVLKTSKSIKLLS